MALTGRFDADFQSFYTACQQAETHLRSFESGSNKVGAALNRMVDSFSGRKIISEATIMVEAVDRVGGVSKLTEKELARVGAAASEAAAKMRAMGIDVPPGLQKIADATRSTGGFFQDLGKQVAVTAAGFISAQAVLHLVGAAFHELTDAAKGMWDIVLSGAGVADVEENFQRLTSSAGLLGETLLGELRDGTHATITDFELMKTVNQDLAAGMRLTDDQFGTLAKGAFALAQATGTDVKSALDTMNDAMLTGRTRALAMLTGKIDLEAAETKFAASIGRTRDQLSEAGKLEAARMGILDGVSAATARLGEQTDGLDERVAQAQTAWGNLKEELGKTIAKSTVLEAALVALADGLTGTFGSDKQGLVTAIAHKVDEFAIGLVSVAEAAVTAGGAMVTGFYGAKKIFGDLQQIIDGVRLTLLYVQRAAALGILPGTADVAKWQALDAEIGKTLDTMLLRGKALQEDEKAQAGVDANTQKYIATLEAVRAKMIAAAAAHDQVAGTLDRVSAAHAGAAAGATATAGATTAGAGAIGDWTKKSDEAAKADEARAKIVRELERGIADATARHVPFNQIVAEFGARAQAAAKDAAIYGAELGRLSKAFVEAAQLEEMFKLEHAAGAATAPAGEAAAIPNDLPLWDAHFKALDDLESQHVRRSGDLHIQAAEEQLRIVRSSLVQGEAFRQQEVAAIEAVEQAKLAAALAAEADRFGLASRGIAQNSLLYGDLVAAHQAAQEQMTADYAAGAAARGGDAEGERERRRLEATGEVARRTFEAMKVDGVSTAAQIEAAWQAWHDQDAQATHGLLTRWNGALDEMAAGFAQLAQIAGDSFGGIVQKIGVVTSAMSMAGKAGDTFGQGLQKHKDGVAGGFADMATGVMGVASSFTAATSSSSKFQNTLGGAATGAKFGAQFAGPWGAAVGAVIGGVAGLLKTVFGGPSAAELAGREAAGKYRAELEKTLTTTQRLEAGNDKWKMSVIAIRDAYIANGATEAEALAASQRLWEAEKKGPEAVKAEIEKISLAMGNYTAATAALEEFSAKNAAFAQVNLETSLAAIEQERDARLSMLTGVGPLMDAARQEIDKFYNHERDIALETMDTIEERMRKKGYLTRQELQDEADAAVKAYDQMLASGLYTADVLERAWKAAMDATDAAIGKTAANARALAAQMKSYDRGTGQTGQDAKSLSPEDAEKYITDFLAHNSDISRDRVEQFLNDNPGDEGRLGIGGSGNPFSEYKAPEFATGTGGRYLDFGKETLVKLHGRERVMTEGERDREGGAWPDMAVLDGRLRSIEQLLGRLPTHLRDALLLAAR